MLTADRSVTDLYILSVMSHFFRPRRPTDRTQAELAHDGRAAPSSLSKFACSNSFKDGTGALAATVRDVQNLEVPNSDGSIVL